MEALLTKPVIVALAILGAALSVGASVFKGHARWLNIAGYTAMGVSMLLFAIAGLRGTQP
jgi:predicted membrane channel-forming protein YqfA (hemolysin III family)